MKVFFALDRDRQRNLLLLFGSGLLFWLSITSLLPVLPAYVQYVSPGDMVLQGWGWNLFLSVESQVGLVMGCFALGLLVFRSPLGQLADRRGRKWAITIGAVVVGAAPLGYIYTESIPLLMALRAFHGISIAAFTTGYSALVVDLSPVQYRGQLLGYMSLVTPIGMSIGPAVGGYMSESGGYRLLFFVAAIAGFLALFLASWVQEDFQAPVGDRAFQSAPKGRFWQILKSRSLGIPAVVMLLVGLLFGTLTTFLPLYFRASGVDLNIGLFYTGAAIASFLVRLLTGTASDRYGRGVFISLSLACYGVSMILLAIAQTGVTFLGAAILEGCGGGILIPMAIALMSDRSYSHERGLVYAICIGGFDLGIALAGPGLGFLANSIGYRGLYGLASSFAWLALLVFMTQGGKNLLHSWRFATGRAKDCFAVK
ncbi:MAG: MFS transporter [Jaaginema sp. PMC 1079.18]|nr:MFS transporter [Jaaginema sp. PMC 1080.18]MEC4849598.1 MFS transporter [Jaaginema sp. PMC 1079.18]MEC4867110.1 MFS transporter [Jaaginema sp. PMC 1078.18]